MILMLCEFIDVACTPWGGWLGTVSIYMYLTLHTYTHTHNNNIKLKERLNDLIKVNCFSPALNISLKTVGGLDDWTV